MNKEQKDILEMKKAENQKVFDKILDDINNDPECNEMTTQDLYTNLFWVMKWDLEKAKMRFGLND